MPGQRVAASIGAREDMRGQRLRGCLCPGSNCGRWPPEAFRRCPIGTEAAAKRYAAEPAATLPLSLPEKPDVEAPIAARPRPL